MPQLECFERMGSRRTSGDEQGAQVETTWIVIGTNDSDVALALMLSTATDSHLDAESGQLLKMTSYDIEQVGYQLWEGNVQYRTPGWKPGSGNGLAPGVVSFAFDTSGGTVHITQSLATRHKYYLDGEPEPADFQGAIGVQKDSIEGVDIAIGGLRFSETHQLPAEFVTVAWVKHVAAITARTNAEAFRDFAPGEVLFLGATGDFSSDQEAGIRVTFAFEAQENATKSKPLTIGEFTGIEKGGHEYLWTYYEDQVDTDAKELVKRPRWIYVEQCYRSADFNVLGIGA